MGLEAPTCVTVYAFDEKEIYKKYLKLRQRYEGKKRKFDLLVRNVPAEVFAYKVVEPGVGRVIIDPKLAEAAADKADRATAKAQRKAEKKARKAEKKAQKK